MTATESTALNAWSSSARGTGDALAFVEAVAGLNTREALFAHLTAAVARLGFQHVAYAGLTYDEPFRDPSIPQPAIMLNYPPSWTSHYFAQGYERVDPVVLYSAGMPEIYEWSALRTLYDLSPVQRRILDEAEEAGLAYGLTVPLHGPRSQVAIVSLASATNVPLTHADFSYLTVLASQFHIAYCRLSAAATAAAIHLSTREAECLRWTALGKSSWDISVIMRISENTVNFHMKNVMRKLGASSRIVAVLKAIELGLLVLSQF